MPAEIVEQDIDRGMWDILIELNKKGYKTNVCCEGHLSESGWNGYIGFVYPFEFPTYPKNFSHMKNRMYYYWDGKTEESRQKFLEELLKWAEILPERIPVTEKTFTLIGRNKKRPASREKILINTNNYEDIKAILNRQDMEKYDLRIIENTVRKI